MFVGIFINTAGVGIVEHNQTIAPQIVQPGDAILISGDIGRHGISIMAVREGLELETTIESDCAPLHDMVLEMLNHKDYIRSGLTQLIDCIIF